METDKQQDENKRSIELRSEKVRNIVGQIPPALLRFGVLIISLVLIVLVVISTFIPYKETIAIDATLYTVPQTSQVTAPGWGIIMVDSLYREAKEGQTVGYIQVGNQLIAIQVPVAGRLIWNVLNRDQVKAGSVLLVVVPDNLQTIYGEAEVSREQLSKIQIEDKVVLSSPQGQQFTGNISHIYPLPTDNGMNRIHLDFENIDSCPVSGMKIDGKIILSESTIFKKVLSSLGIK